MPGERAHKFDPARAHLLDSSDRDAFLPDRVIVELLELEGSETVLDYGAGTGRVALAVAERLPRGRVVAIDESPEMLERLRARTAEVANIEVLAVRDNRVPLPDRSAQRILAVNLLHEVRGESALEEMARLLAVDGTLLVVDWDRERPSEPGPPVEHRYTAAGAERDLHAAGLATERLETDLPFHFVLRARLADGRDEPSQGDDPDGAAG
jgi:ubiquinone/menaquinone biosynthesis C-methylase UbiE